jgi:AGCS family alanine or glycine:cation symporter
LCWAHYGAEGIKYFSSKRSARKIYIALYTVSVLLGAVLSTEPMWQMADLSIGVMTLINLSALLVRSREVKQETESYFDTVRKKE